MRKVKTHKCHDDCYFLAKFFTTHFSFQDYKVLRQIASGAFGSVHCVQRRDSKVIHAAKYVNAAGPDLDREVKINRCKTQLFDKMYNIILRS